MQRAWDREAERWKIGARLLRDSVMTRSRLRARGAELAAVLKASGSNARSEVFLQDDVHMLYGQLDVIVDDPGGGAVVDLKTGTDSDRESVRTQLLIYASLFKRESGHLPTYLVAFSLRRGPVQIEFSQADVDDLLARVGAAREQPGLAIPDAAGCKYCRRRLVCEPHWSAAAAWAEPDCVEGLVSKVENAAAGLTAVRISSGAGEQWVTGLASLHSQALNTGSKIRVTEVVGRGAGEEREWRATRSTRVSVLPKEG